MDNSKTHERPNALILMGPTASGKTTLAVELSQTHPIEIINVDSALIYQDMNIGTAKPSQLQQSQVKHHLIDIITPLQSYSVAKFIQDINCIIRDIIQRNKIPFLVGGTMMYFNAIINGISTLPQSNPQIRQEIETKLSTHGVEFLHKELSNIDLDASNKINPNDTQRIIRALEVYYISGQPISYLQKANNINILSDINFHKFALIPEDRTHLHNTINKRLDEMMTMGFIDEVVQLKHKYKNLTIKHNSMRCVGYHEVWQYLENELTYNELLEKAKASTRQLAKRQLTWLRQINCTNISNNINATIDTLLIKM